MAACETSGLICIDASSGNVFRTFSESVVNPENPVSSKKRRKLFCCSVMYACARLRTSVAGSSYVVGSTWTFTSIAADRLFESVTVTRAM